MKWKWDHECEQNKTRNEVIHETDLTYPRITLIGMTQTGWFEYSEKINFCPYCGKDLRKGDNDG